jgi:hypothetical protein
MDIECGNVDSCKPAQRHWFPDMNVVVRFKQDTTVKVLGEDRDIEVRAGTPAVTTGDLIVEAHQAAVVVGLAIVWADVEDDIEVVTNRLEPGEGLIGKTIARVEERMMAGRDTFKDTVSWTNTVLTFTDGSTATFADADGEVYDAQEIKGFTDDGEPIPKEA